MVGSYVLPWTEPFQAAAHSWIRAIAAPQADTGLGLIDGVCVGLCGWWRVGVCGWWGVWVVGGGCLEAAAVESVSSLLSPRFLRVFPQRTAQRVKDSNE